MARSVLIAGAVLLSLAAGGARAQTANASPTTSTGRGGSSAPGTGTGSGVADTSRTPPAASTARPTPGVPQIGAPTPLDRQEDRQGQKDTSSVCKGC